MMIGYGETSLLLRGDRNGKFHASFIVSRQVASKRCHADCCVTLACVDSHRIDEPRWMLCAWCIIDANSNPLEAFRSRLPLESRLGLDDERNRLLCWSTSLFLLLTLILRTRHAPQSPPEACRAWLPASDEMPDFVPIPFDKPDRTVWTARNGARAALGSWQGELTDRAC